MVSVFYLRGELGNPANGARIVEIPYVAADVETTGLSAADGHRVCEIALLRFLRGTVMASFVSLVNPLRPIDPGASAVNGITDAMVAGAPAFANLLRGSSTFWPTTCRFPQCAVRPVVPSERGAARGGIVARESRHR